MNKTSWNTKFSKIIEQNKQCLYKMCKVCMENIMEDPNIAQEEFRYFLTQIQLPRFVQEELPEDFFYVEEDEINSNTQNRIKEMEDHIVKELILRDVSEDEFYVELWNRLCDTLLVSDDYQKSYFFCRMWLDPRIPYYQLGLGITMDNETYQKYVEQLVIADKKAGFVLSAGYPQRTQRAAILMKIADGISDEKARAVFWSLILGRFEYQISQLGDYIQKLQPIIEQYEAATE